MKTPFPWRAFTLLSVAAGLILATVYAVVGYDDHTYHPAMTAIEFLDLTPAEHWRNAVKYSALAFAIVTIATFLLLCLLRCTWYFLLARLSELSQAIKTNP